MTIRRIARIAALTALIFAAIVVAGSAQEPLTAAAVAQSSQQPIPNLVRTQGVLPAHSNEKLALRFSVYAAEASHNPLWTEDQTVQTDEKGKFSVLLGAGSAIGLPQSLFVAGEPRWLAVQLGDHEEQRTLLASVPYALKAADADSLGGVPATSFATQEQVAQLASRLNTTASALTANALRAFPELTPTGAGSTGYLPIWSSSSTLGNSGLFQIGAGAASKLGIGTTAPATSLDVNGVTTLRGRVALTGTAATATAGVNSPFLELNASAYNSASTSAVAQNFYLQAQPLGNNTATPSAQLSLLYAFGTHYPAATGLSFSPTGLITFAPGQAFPGTISGVIAGTGLTGGGATGNVTLNLDTTKIPQLSTYNSFASGATFGAETTITGSSTDWMFVVTNTSAASKGTILGQAAGNELAIEGASPSGIGVKGASDNGFGFYGIANLNGTAIYGAAYGTGAAGSFWSQSISGPTVVVKNTTGTALTASAVTGYAGSFSNNATYYATVNATNSGTGNAGYFQNNSATRVALAGVNNSTANGAIGTYGSASNGDGVYGIATAGGTGVYGTATNSTGVQGVSTGGFGVIGTSISGDGILGKSQSLYGVYGSSQTGGAVYGELGFPTVESGSVQAKGSIWGDAGDATSYTPIGVVGTADNGGGGFFANNSTGYYTLGAYNASGGSTHNFSIFVASSPRGACGVGGNGDITCTGQVKSVVTTATARQVETYSVQSSENWLEDFGSGTLSNGRAVIRLDPAFADAANTAVDYHVFVSPEGEAQPLYITAKSPQTFEVRETGAAGHSISFSYRIVARRRGVESQRLVDVTDSLKAEMDAAQPKGSQSKLNPPSPHSNETR